MSTDRLIDLIRRHQGRGEFAMALVLAGMISDELLRVQALNKVVAAQKEIFLNEQLEYLPKHIIDKRLEWDASSFAQDIKKAYGTVYDAWFMVSHLRRLEHTNQRKISTGGIEHEYEKDIWVEEVLPRIGSTESYRERILAADEAVSTLIEHHFKACRVGYGHYWGGGGEYSHLHAAVIAILPNDLTNVSTTIALIDILPDPRLFP